MQILAINGSPHRVGNTFKLIDAILAGAREQGHAGEIVHLVDLHLDYCNWCGECADTGLCRIDDGLREHVECIACADVLIVATPSSSHSVTGYMKNWLDRFCNSQLIFQVDANRQVHMRSRVPTGKRAIVVVQGCTDNLQATVEPIDAVMNALQITVLARLIVPGIGLTDEDTVERHPDVLTQARTIGRSIPVAWPIDMEGRA